MKDNALYLEVDEDITSAIDKLSKAPAGPVQIVLAWTYVALRAVHSWIHIVPKRVQPRFLVYLISCTVLSAMWIGFAVEMLGR